MKNLDLPNLCTSLSHLWLPSELRNEGCHAPTSTWTTLDENWEAVVSCGHQFYVCHAHILSFWKRGMLWFMLRTNCCTTFLFDFVRWKGSCGKDNAEGGRFPYRLRIQQKKCLFHLSLHKLRLENEHAAQKSKAPKGCQNDFLINNATVQTETCSCLLRPCLIYGQTYLTN